MGQDQHVPFEDLSALRDGELPTEQAAAARAHLGACGDCGATFRSLSLLDEELRLPAAVACEAGLLLLSAAVDGEADRAEAAVAERHLLGCASCRAAERAWVALAPLLASPLSAPSARVDAAMAALAAGRARPPRAPWPRLAPGLPLRGAVAALLALAVALGGSLIPAEDGTPAAAGPSGALVAAVQQVVLDPRTNTIYVARPEVGAVSALDATTHAVRAEIPVGGRPTALALDAEAYRLLVLDASSKRLSEIDTLRNTVISATRLDIAGTPTSVQVDNGKIVVSTVLATPAPAAATAAPASGVVAVFDTVSKRLETKQSVAVAPRLVVPDPAGRRTLLVSAESTSIVDASYREIGRIAGGIGAAFGTGDRVAVLASTATGGRLSFHGDGAPADLDLDGRARTVIGLPDGRFAVLLDGPRGAGRIAIVEESGRVATEIDLAVSGRDLAFDPATRRFTVVGGGELATAALPAPVVQAPVAAGTPPPPARPSATPAPPATGTPTPAGTPSPSPSATAPAAAQPPASASPRPADAGVPAGAVALGGGIYRVALPDGRVPVLTAVGEGRLWFLDERNQLAALDTASGEVFTVAELPRDAAVRSIAVGQSHVYAVDVARGRLFALGIADERVATYLLPATDVTALAVAPDGTVWVATPASTNLLAFDPAAKRFQAVDVGVRGAVALAADIGGRLWFSDGVGRIGAYDPLEGRVLQVSWPGRAPSVLLRDGFGRVWTAAATGEIYLVSPGVATLMAGTARPITALTLDAGGRPWYLAPAATGRGFSFGPVDGSSAVRTVSGPASDLALNRAGRTWLVDPSGGFYLALEVAR